MMLPRLPKYYVKAATCLLGFLLLWISGLLDHAREKSFSRFEWPIETVDVRTLAVDLLADHSSSVPVLNDMDNLPVLIQPSCPKSDDDTVQDRILLIVKSNVHNVNNREAIRRSWGKSNLIDGYGVRTIFVVGRFASPSDEKHMKVAVQQEAEKNRDLLWIDAVDTYRNNTLKLLHSIHYAYSPAHSCQRSDFVLLIDDDYMLSMENLVRLIKSKHPYNILYEGWRFDTSPFRYVFHKHRVSLSDYPFDAYPPYITAGAVLISKQTVSYFFQAMKFLKLYPYDDIYTGIVAYQLGIIPSHNDGFVFWKRTITSDEWKHGSVICAHGFEPDEIETTHNVINLNAAG
ncbi:hypothetical protein WR25_22583 [Diploscapter pachys]|uniref:Hexosyltransferase n=1 Tax=Diploscapter pachys TaxID=2018661 RepID=A0A2A2KJT9_9BILA|nr:hypothetical protein WR25_22583 [Diploscapter pachys]